MIGIYKFENRYTHEVYIGQSIHIEARYLQHKYEAEQLRKKTKLYLAMHDHFEDFDFDIVELCSAEELDDREKYWITYYDSFENGLNSVPGGHNQTSIYNEQDFFNLWDEGYSVKQIAETLKCSPTTVQNYLIGYKNYSATESNRRGGILARETAKQHGEVQQSEGCVVFQFTLTGELINSFRSKKEAMRVTGVDENSIRKVIMGERASAGGYKWSDSEILTNTKTPAKGTCEVHQYSLTNEYINTFPSYAAAAKSLGRNDGSLIRRVCNDPTKTAYGYRWKN